MMNHCAPASAALRDFEQFVAADTLCISGFRPGHPGGDKPRLSCFQRGSFTEVTADSVNPVDRHKHLDKLISSKGEGVRPNRCPTNKPGRLMTPDKDLVAESWSRQ